MPVNHVVGYIGEANEQVPAEPPGVAGETADSAQEEVAAAAATVESAPEAVVVNSGEKAARYSCGKKRSESETDGISNDSRKWSEWKNSSERCQKCMLLRV
ncbi:hypothetical protein GCM10020331_013480 [Ectobacillus funiculus]